MIFEIALFASLIFPRHEVIANHIIIETHKANLPVVPVLLTVWKESRFNPKACNPKDLDGRRRCGMLQYDIDTFNHLKTISKMPHLSIKNWKDELTLFLWSVKNGEAWRWPPLQQAMKDIKGIDISGY